MYDRFPCISRSIISSPTNFIQSHLHLVIMNLTVKILTNSNNLFGNPLDWTIFLLRKCIPVHIKIWRNCSQVINCFPLSQVKVCSFCFRPLVRRDWCGGLIVSTVCVRRCHWSALLWPTDVSESSPRFRGDIPWKHIEFPEIKFFNPFFLWWLGRSCVWSGESWSELKRLGEKWWKSLIISDNQVETYLIITINDTSIGDLPLIITNSDTYKNQTKRIDFDNTINLWRLIVLLEWWVVVVSFIPLHTVTVKLSGEVVIRNSYRTGPPNTSFLKEDGPWPDHKDGTGLMYLFFYCSGIFTRS